jgi:glutathione S-transferase
MKFYDCQTAPSPRRARIALAEKGLLDKIEKVEINMREKEQMGEAFRAINPFCTVPVLDLDDGTRLLTTSGIWHFLDAYQPDPPLMGRTPEERGRVADRQWRIEIDGTGAVGECLRNSVPGMAGRSVTGPVSYEQIPDLAERGRARAQHFMGVLDELIGDQPFVAGEVFSVADIDAVVFVDFAKWIKIEIPDGAKNLARWCEAMNARPSVGL